MSNFVTCGTTACFSVDRWIGRQWMIKKAEMPGRAPQLNTVSVK